MHHAESLEEFYRRTRSPERGIFTRNHGHINVYNREYCQGATVYRRRDFYKITLIDNGGVLHYADKSIELALPALIFSNPMIPYAFEPTPGKQTGYFCVFTEEFIQDKNYQPAEASMFRPGGNPVYFITEEQRQFLAGIFERMMTDMASEYAHKQALLHNYIQLLIHEALKMEPANDYFRQQNAASRIADLFIELLERQFPIEHSRQVLSLKTAADYARQLSVHVNYLNRAVKEDTGKTTSAHIAERIIREAKVLLMHTSWNINEIAYSLGFEYPSYFNNFFRRHTDTTPRAFRKEEALEQI